MCCYTTKQSPFCFRKSFQTAQLALVKQMYLLSLKKYAQRTDVHHIGESSQLDNHVIDRSPSMETNHSFATSALRDTFCFTEHVCEMLKEINGNYHELFS